MAKPTPSWVLRMTVWRRVTPPHLLTGLVLTPNQEINSCFVWAILLWGIYLLQQSLHILCNTNLVNRGKIQSQSRARSKADWMLNPWCDVPQLQNFSQLWKGQMRVGIESLRVDYAATATQVERMQAKKLFSYLTMLNRTENLLESNKFSFLFHALRYLHARDNEKINYNCGSAFSPFNLVFLLK